MFDILFELIGGLVEAAAESAPEIIAGGAAIVGIAGIAWLSSQYWERIRNKYGTQLSGGESVTIAERFNNDSPVIAGIINRSSAGLDLSNVRKLTGKELETARAEHIRRREELIIIK